MASPTPPPRATAPDTRRTVLVTGCSAHGLGHALALAFHDAGLRVFATARNPDRMAELQARGIECLQLDVLDEQSIRRCVEAVRGLTTTESESEGGLNCLVNNAGGGYNMPVADISIPEAKALFDLNVWSCVAVTQAFLPLLINAANPVQPATASQSKPRVRRPPPPSLILNNTSVSSVEPTPHNSAYHASKAAAAMFSTHMRLELQPFGVHVVDLKTGCVHSHFHANHQAGRASLPAGSIYGPVREQTESAMRNAFPLREDPARWAADVVRDVLTPWAGATVAPGRLPLEIWRGTGAWRTWFYNCTFWPVGWWDEWWRKAVGLDLLREKVRQSYGA